jgi:hypothetical protein
MTGERIRRCLLCGEPNPRAPVHRVEMRLPGAEGIFRMPSGRLAARIRGEAVYVHAYDPGERRRDAPGA